MKTSVAGLLDTSTVINLPRLTDATTLPEVPLISTITLAELSWVRSWPCRDEGSSDDDPHR